MKVGGVLGEEKILLMWVEPYWSGKSQDPFNYHCQHKSF